MKESRLITEALNQSDQCVFRHYSLAALDAEYNNSAKVIDAASIIQNYTRLSNAYRESASSALNISYGDTAAETLDLFFPNHQTGEPGQSRPVHVFFHGGYWQAMHKEDFSYVANAFDETNTIVAVTDYGLIPDVTMTELVDQCRNALAWLYRNIGNWGGDPHTLSLSGHSAGGHLVGMMIATAWQKRDPNLPVSLVKAGVSLSGLFDLAPIRLCYLNQTLGLTPQDAQLHSPLLLRNENSARLWCLYGALEGEEYARQSQFLANAWGETTASAMDAHDHFTIAQALGDPASEVSGYLRSLTQHDEAQA